MVTKVTQDVADLFAQDIGIDSSSFLSFSAEEKPSITTAYAALLELDKHSQRSSLHGIAKNTVANPDNIITINSGDNTLIDIESFEYFNNGVHHQYDGATGVQPILTQYPNEVAVAFYIDSNGDLQQKEGAIFLDLTEAYENILIGYVILQGNTGSPVQTVVTSATVADKNIDQIWRTYGVGTIYSSGAGVVTNSATNNKLSLSTGRCFLPNGEQRTVQAATDFTFIPYRTNGSGIYVAGTPTDTWDNSQIDDGAGNLVAMTTDYWTFHTIARSASSETIYLIWADTEYATQQEAYDAAGNANVSPFGGAFGNEEASPLTPIATIVFQKGMTSAQTIRDQRPAIGSSGATISGSNQAADISFDNSGTSLASNDVQSAIVENDGRISTLEARVFGSEQAFQQDLSTRTTTSTTFQTALTLNIPSGLPAGNYRVLVTFNLSHGATATAVEARVQYDGVTNGRVISMQPRSAADVHNFAPVFIQNIIDGNPHTVTLQYRSTSGSTASISDTVIEFWRVS